MFGCTRFTKLDLEKAYHHVPIYEPHRHKSAVSTPQGMFEFNRMNFGMKTCAQTFQRYLDSIFRDLSSFLFVYIDDIIIYSRTEEEHLKHIELVFKRLAEHNLKINTTKCKFNQERLEFLGFDVCKDGISPSSSRIESLISAPIPNTVGKMKQFLGMTAYYHHFIRNVAKIKQPLNSFLTTPKKNNNQKIELSDRQLEAFQQLNDAIANPTMMAHPMSGATLLIHI